MYGRCTTHRNMLLVDRKHMTNNFFFFLQNMTAVIVLVTLELQKTKHKEHSDVMLGKYGQYGLYRLQWELEVSDVKSVIGCIIHYVLKWNHSQKLKYWSLFPSPTMWFFPKSSDWLWLLATKELLQTANWGKNQSKVV